MRLASFLLLVSALAAVAQTPGLTLPYSGNNQKASVTQFIGPVTVTIEYSSPRVTSPAGQDRRGKIWGELVPYGPADLNWLKRDGGPWRAGANENTVFAVSDPVLVEGKQLSAGRYGLHMIPGKTEWTVIFSRNSASWGSFFYKESEDALRVTVTPKASPFREWLSYEFTRRLPDEATVELQWEELAVPIAIKVEDMPGVYISKLRDEVRSAAGFSWQNLAQAAQYCAGVNRNLDEALDWAEAAINRPLVGVKNFTTLSAKAQVLTSMGRKPEAAALMTEAIEHPTATVVAIHQYARQLQAAGQSEEAMAVYRRNAARFGDEWPVNVGMMRVESSVGNLKKALEHAKKAHLQAPDGLNRQNLERMIALLEAGKPVP